MIERHYAKHIAAPGAGMMRRAAEALAIDQPTGKSGTVVKLAR
jgi:hypothetical protein